MKIIAFDTTNSLCSVALFDHGQIKSFKTTTEPSKQAESLLNLIKEVLAENKLSYQQLDGLALTIGPGSFTGVRIALAAAKGLQLITKLPVIALSNLELIAWTSYAHNPGLEKDITVFLNARRDQLYTQSFNRQLQATNEAKIIKIKQVLLEPNAIITGDGVELLNVSSQFPNVTINAQILAQSLIYFAPHRFSNKLAPLYIREANITTQKS